MKALKGYVTTQIYGRKKMAVELVNLAFTMLTTTYRKRLEKMLVFTLPEVIANYVKLSDIKIKYCNEYMMLGVNVGFLPADNKP